jgi:hypothetical protein
MGLLAILDVLRHTLEIEVPPLLRISLLTVGIMSMALRILLTVCQKAYSNQSFWNITYGRVVLNGFDPCQLVGRNSPVFLPVKPLTRIICLQDYTKDFTCTKISSFDQLI